MRLFLAIPADPGWAESTRRLVERLRPGSPPASWTRSESWHLTLKFLSEVSDETAARFGNGIGEAVGRQAAGILESAGAMFLPGPGRPRVLGVGFAPSSPAAHSISAIAEAAERLFRRLGGEPVARPFRPHVTLCRLRQPWPREAIESSRREVDAWRFPDWPVRSCVLFESRLAPSGAVHTPLREWTLAPQTAAVPA